MYTIDRNSIDSYARTNEKLLQKPVCGVILEFPGLGGGSCMGGQDAIGVYDAPHAKEYADKGILLAYVFTGPWSWMNYGAVRMADAIVEAIFDRFSLPDSTPLVYIGGSMGAQSALIYSKYARRKPVACAVNGPPCDMFATYYMHEAFPRTVYNALSHYDMPIEKAIESISPLHQIEGMPDIPYFVVHCDKDEVIPIDKNADPWVGAMREKGHDVTYIVCKDRTHCDITHEAWESLCKFVLDNIGKSL